MCERSDDWGIIDGLHHSTSCSLLRSPSLRESTSAAPCSLPSGSRCKG